VEHGLGIWPRADSAEAAGAFSWVGSAWTSPECHQAAAAPPPNTNADTTSLFEVEPTWSLAGRKMLEKFLVRMDKLERGRSSV
jgi:hypothetical protein